MTSLLRTARPTLPVAAPWVLRLRCCVPAVVALCVAALALLHSTTALAFPDASDADEVSPLAERDPAYDEPDVPLHVRFASPLRAPISLGLGGTILKQPAGDTSVSGTLTLSLPLERIAARGVRSASISEAPEPAHTAPPAKGGSSRGDGGSTAAPLTEGVPPPSKPLPSTRLLVLVTPDVARAAVMAALRRAHLLNPDARADDLASRARYAAALPELRLRVLRTVDSGQALSPTEYDPSRTTDKATVALWLEARATWRLDRLLFAEEEVTLERMRQERASAQARLAKQVVRLLFEWQRGLAMIEGGALPPEERLPMALRGLELEAELDLLTDGWFSAWRGPAKPKPRVARATTAPP